MKQVYPVKLGEGEASRFYSLVRTESGLIPRLGDREVSCRATLELLAQEMLKLGLKEELVVKRVSDCFRIDGLDTGGYF